MSVAYQTPTDLAAHYKAVRARLWTATVKAKPVAAPPALMPVVPRRVLASAPPARIEVRLVYKQRIGPTPEWPYALGSNLSTFRDVIEEVCARHGLSELELMSVRREAQLVAARHEMMWLLKNRTTWSLPEIGRRLGGRDHTTILHGVRKHQAKVDAGKLITPRFGEPLTAAELMAKRTAQMAEATKRQAQRGGGAVRGMQSLGDAAGAAHLKGETLSDVPVPLEFQTDLAIEQMARRTALLGMSNAMISQAAARGFNAVLKGSALCESPIEKRILPWLVFGDYGDCFLTIPAEVHSPRHDATMTDADLFIVPQFAFARYRLDFGIIARPSPNRTVIVAVECDGEEFHDARKDAARDDYLRRWNIPTVRAGGEEIHQRPAAVAARAISAVRHMVEA